MLKEGRIRRVPGTGAGVSVYRAQEGGKSQSSPSSSLLPKHLPVRETGLQSLLRQTDALGEPGFQHKCLLTIT